MVETLTAAERARIEEIVDNFRLMDDDFMSQALDGNTKAVGLILRVVLEREDLTVVSVKTQSEYRSALQRSVRLDVCAEDETGKIYDIEIQRSDHGAGVRRARVHSSMMDSTLLEKGQDFEEIPDTYVIFITENDKFKRGLPLYHVERRIEELDYETFGDGTHIIYVNGKYRNAEHPVGRLMHDFHCKRAGEMAYPELAETVRYFKETEGGHGQMCREVEKLMKEMGQKYMERGIQQGMERGMERGAEQEARETAKRMLLDGSLSREMIAKFSQLPLDVLDTLAREL